MTKTNDDLMQELLSAKRKGEKIFYSRKDSGLLSKTVGKGHEWNLQDNVYEIRRRREYIIKIDDRDKNNPIIYSAENNWTRSDFGKVELGEFILMREVYPEEME